MTLHSHSEAAIERATISKTIIAVVLALVVLCLLAGATSAHAATSTQVSNANAEIQSAFVSAYSAEKSGGNISSLVAQLNTAIQLVQKAESENATNPAQASADIQKATSMAQQVASASPSVAQAGTSARRTAEVTSMVATSAIVAVAALVYLLGGRVYRRAWLRLHKDYVVRPANG